MKRWWIILFVALILIGLGFTISWWGTPFLAFLGANSDTIQTLDSLLQLILVAGGFLLGVWGYVRGRKESTPETRIETQGGMAIQDASLNGGDLVNRDKIININVADSARALLAPLQPRLSQEAQQTATEAFLNHLLDRHLYLQLKGMGVSDRIPLRLPLLDLYVPLQARLELPEGETWRRLQLAGRGLPDEEGQALRLSEPQPVLDLLQKHAGLILLGDPGAGKTTFLKFLALQLAFGQGETLGLGTRLPILLPLSAYANALQQTDVRLDDFIAHYFDNLGANLPLAAILTEALNKGAALILLDGLDEVKDLTLRNTVVERVADFYSFHRRKGNKFVLTSRIVGYRQVRPTATDLAECTLVDFDDDEIEAFITRWTTALEKQASGETAVARADATREKAELLDAVRRNPGVRRLAANPLLLTILALMKRQGVTLPERRVQLYDQYVSTLLSQWNRARSLSGRGVGRDLDDVQTLRLLAPLALWMHETNPGVGLVKREDLRRKLTAMLTELHDPDPLHAAQTFLEDVREHAALLLERGPEEYGFIHLTFEEYLSAVALALRAEGKAQTIVDYLTPRVGEQAWREITLLTVSYLGIRQQLPGVAGQVVEGLIACAGGPPGEATVLAGEAVLDALPGGVLPAAKEQVITALAPAMQNAEADPATRRRAGMVLGRLGWVPDDLDAFVEIPAGKFLYGDEKEEKEIPYPYWIGKYPVTNLQYRRFMEDGGYERKELWSAEGWSWRQGKDWDLSFEKNKELRKIWEDQQRRRPAEQRNQPLYWHNSDWNNALFPVVGISWFEAEAYGNWLNTQKLPIPIPTPKGYTVRLPTEQEWERVARGTDGREYPWGDKFEKFRANTSESGRINTTAICNYPQGISPTGAWDMSGNVWEWTNSWYEKPNEYRVLRGGSWAYYVRLARCASRGQARSRLLLRRFWFSACGVPGWFWFLISES